MFIMLQLRFANIQDNACLLCMEAKWMKFIFCYSASLNMIYALDIYVHLMNQIIYQLLCPMMTRHIHRIYASFFTMPLNVEKLI